MYVLTSPVSHGRPGEFWPVSCGVSFGVSLFLFVIDMCAEAAGTQASAWAGGLSRSECFRGWYCG